MLSTLTPTAMPTNYFLIRARRTRFDAGAMIPNAFGDLAFTAFRSYPLGSTSRGRFTLLITNVGTIVLPKRATNVSTDGLKCTRCRHSGSR